MLGTIIVIFIVASIILKDRGSTLANFLSGITNLFWLLFKFVLLILAALYLFSVFFE